LSELGARRDVALVILNYKMRPGMCKALWRGAGLKICADGGANRLYDMLEPAARPQYVPDHIIGDLDSVREDVDAFYAKHGSRMTEVAEQDTNDMEKCVRFVVSARAAAGAAGRQGSTLVPVLGALGGRLDQEMANINALYKFHDHGVELVLVGEHSAAWRVAAGREEITVSRFEGPSCGLIPLGGACASVTTSGLKWNVHKAPLQFGGLVSTSNQCSPGTAVVIETSDPLLWTVDIQDPAPGDSAS